ncbi:MAG: tRNA pseudouridine(55) synthase TruB [Planctomycetota bacterium]
MLPLPELKKLLRHCPERLVGRTPGFYLIDKPEGPTSHDMVYRARKALGIRRVGHGGTLDPMATGLLIIMAGNAARLFDAMQEYTKSYTATLRFGIATDTQDITGEVLEERPVPPLTSADLETALATFRGEILQTPPMYSALKKDGVPLYKLAREGKVVEREARPVRVDALTLDRLDAEANTATISMTVSKGFYVRTLIHDLGEAMGCGATMTQLRRTAIGPFHLNSAIPIEEVEPGAEPEPIENP